MQKKYEIELSERFQKEFRKLDKYTQKMIRSWINKNLVDCENPRQHGKGLTTNRSGQWRYRIGDYRVIAHIDDNKLIILALSVGHRKEVDKSVVITGNDIVDYMKVVLRSVGEMTTQIGRASCRERV